MGWWKKERPYGREETWRKMRGAVESLVLPVSVYESPKTKTLVKGRWPEVAADDGGGRRKVERMMVMRVKWEKEMVVEDDMVVDVEVIWG